MQKLRVILSLIVAVSVLFGTTVAFGQHGEHSQPVQSGGLTAAEVKAFMGGKSKVSIIDVRSLQEYKYSHIPGAINVPSPAVKMLVNRFPKDKTALIIMYARGDDYSNLDRAFNRAFKMGYTNIKIFRGGILEWNDQHYPVRKGTRP